MASEGEWPPAEPRTCCESVATDPGMEKMQVDLKLHTERSQHSQLEAVCKGSLWLASGNLDLRRSLTMPRTDRSGPLCRNSLYEQRGLQRTRFSLLEAWNFGACWAKGACMTDPQ